MKTLTFAITDEQAAQIEAEGERQGISPDAVVQRAVAAFLSESIPTSQHQADEPNGTGSDPAIDYSSQLWFIGLG